MGHMGGKKAGGERVGEGRKGFRYRVRSRTGPGNSTVRGLCRMSDMSGQFLISCGLRKWGWLRKGSLLDSGGLLLSYPFLSFPSLSILSHPIPFLSFPFLPSFLFFPPYSPFLAVPCRSFTFLLVTWQTYWAPCGPSGPEPGFPFPCTIWCCRRPKASVWQLKYNWLQANKI